MISPDYFEMRWSWYRPILNRQEQPGDMCAVEVRRLPIRISGKDGGEYIPFAVQAEIDVAITGSLRRLHDYANRYMVKGEKVSAHTLPQMDARVRAIVTYLRRQNPHISRDLLHHWCAEPHGAPALLNVCEVLWELGWKQDQADSAPWVSAVNVLLLRLIRSAIASLPEEDEMVSHVMLCVVGGLYVWALQEFLKRYLEGVVEMERISNYESMMLPVTPMVFLRHQPDSTLLADDSYMIRAYGLDPEIVPQMRYLIGKIGDSNEGGVLQLLAKDRMGEHLLRRSWARLSLWKLAMKSGNGSWMRWVLDAKRLDQLLAGQVQLDEMAMGNLRANRDEPVAEWLLQQLEGAKRFAKSDKPWLRDKITLLAFRVFDEDVRVEIARRKAEHSWLDRKVELSTTGKRRTGLMGVSELRATTGIRGGRDAASEKRLEEAWQDGELVLIQPDVSKSLHSGKSLASHQGCMRVEWSDYLARIYAMSGPETAMSFVNDRFMPAFFAIFEKREGLFLDECSASGCMLRGSIVSLSETAQQLREQLRTLYLEGMGEEGVSNDGPVSLPQIAMCIDITGEWLFCEKEHPNLGRHHIAFSLAVPQVDAGIVRDEGISRMIRIRNEKRNLKPVGSVNVERIKMGGGESVQIVHNAGVALTASAMKELTASLRERAHIHEFRLSASQVEGVLDGYRLPPSGLELLVIRRHDDKSKGPMLLMKVGKPNLAGVDVELYELLDDYSEAVKKIINQGLMRWQ